MHRNHHLSHHCTSCWHWYLRGRTSALAQLQHCHKHLSGLLVHPPSSQKAHEGCFWHLPLQRGRTYILALSTGLGKLVLVAGDTVEVITLGEEAPRSNHLLALAAGEAILVPHHLLVLNILISYNK